MSAWCDFCRFYDKYEGCLHPDGPDIQDNSSHSCWNHEYIDVLFEDDDDEFDDDDEEY